jgi:hypothetical protein
VAEYKKSNEQSDRKDIGERETRYNDDDLMMNVWIRKIRNDIKCGREIPDTTKSSTQKAACCQNILEEKVTMVGIKIGKK